jgi:hypothetical protein
MQTCQPGDGYNFSASSMGFSLGIDPGFVTYVPIGDGGDGPPHPFKVISGGTIEGVTTVTVITGAVNNSIPTNMSASLTVTSSGYVWVAAGYDSTNKVFPDPTNLTIAAGATLPTSTTSVAYIALAQIVSGTVNQLVTGSLWGDRIQVGSGGTASAHYYFARV